MNNLLYYIMFSIMIEYLSEIISILSLLLTALLWFIYNKKFKWYEARLDKKLISYSELINYSRAFMNDPTLTFEERKLMANNFLLKYYNEILPFSSKAVILSVQNFLFNSWTNFVDTQQNNQTKALAQVIAAIRSDLWLEKIDFAKIEFHAINEVNFLQKELPKNNKQ